MDRQDLAARLARWHLKRDDTGPFRVYRDKRGRPYSSITYIINETSTNPFKKPEPGTWFHTHCGNAAQRGTKAHEAVEYLLKTARKLITHSANRRNMWKTNPDHGLWQVPTQLTRWGLGKAFKQLPDIPFYASGYADGLIEWAMDNITSIYLIEFSVCKWSSEHNQGFAGTGDGLFDINHSGPYVIDWKTTGSDVTLDSMVNYAAQAGAYSLGLLTMVDLQAPGAFIVVGKRTGVVNVHEYLGPDLIRNQQLFASRFSTYCELQSRRSK